MKKKTTLLLFLFFSSFLMNSQNGNRDQPTIPEADVPVLVIENQKNYFPEGFVTQWQLQKGLTATDQNAVRYISKFEDAGKMGFSASYLPNGNLIFFSEYITKDDIPSNVKDKIQVEFQKEFQIDNGDFITVYIPKREMYRIRLRDKTRMQFAYYDTNGEKIEEESLPPEIILFDR